MVIRMAGRGERFYFFLILAVVVALSGLTAAGQNVAGSVLSFDGIQQFVDCGGNNPSYNLTNQLTIEAWVNGQFTNNTYQTIARKGDDYYLAVYGRHPYARIYTNGWKIVQGLDTLKDNTWYHLALTYDRDEGGAYADLAYFDFFKEDAVSPLLLAGGAQGWDQYFRELGNMLYDPDDPNPAHRYKLFYSGYNGSYRSNNVYIGCAYSPDGERWTKVDSPLPGRLIDSPSAEDPYCVEVNGTYHLYFEWKNPVNGNHDGIGHATSSDGVTYTVQGLVLTTAGGGSWETEDVSSPVVWVEDGAWYLMYEGREWGGQAGLIGLARSTDGVHWVRDPNNPVFGWGPKGDWDESAVVGDDIVKVDGTYYFFYHGWGASGNTGFWEGLATSADLYHWTRYKNNPVCMDTDTIMYTHDGNNGVIYVDRSQTSIRRFHPYMASAPRLYVNGVQRHYSTRNECGNQPVRVDASGLYLGKAPAGSYFFRGMMDDVRLWNRALTDAEIQENRMRALAPDEPNLVADWNFNENAGEVVHDSSINHNTAYRGGHVGVQPSGTFDNDPVWVIPWLDWQNHNICDINQDGRVNEGDLITLMQNWLMPVPSCTLSDFNCDGVVNLSDFGALAGQWLWTKP
jgi:beta-1,2-mannobiose phosphorylase / 1,2-beta-oligomannan phosphorylase